MKEKITKVKLNKNFGMFLTVEQKNKIIADKIERAKRQSKAIKYLQKKLGY